MVLYLSGLDKMSWLLNKDKGTRTKIYQDTTCQLSTVYLFTWEPNLRLTQERQENHLSMWSSVKKGHGKQGQERCSSFNRMCDSMFAHLTCILLKWVRVGLKEKHLKFPPPPSAIGNWNTKHTSPPALPILFTIHFKSGNPGHRW